MTLSAPLLAFVATLALALGSMVVFAMTGRRVDGDAQKRGSQFLLGAGDFLVHWFMWTIGPLERAALGLGLTPDFFNFAGLFAGAVSGILIGLGHLELGGWAIVAGGVCDILDGRVARATGAVSTYGTFIDSTLDRFVEVFAFLGFVFFFQGHPWAPLAAAAAMAGSLLVSYTRARGESLGVLCKEGLMQRAERLVLVLISCMIDPSLSAWWGRAPGFLVSGVLVVIALGTFWTSVHRTVWISARLRNPPSAGTR